MSIPTRRLYALALESPSTSAQAIEQVDTWLGSPSLAILTESGQTWSVTRNLLVAAQIVGPNAYGVTEWTK